MLIFTCSDWIMKKISTNQKAHRKYTLKFQALVVGCLKQPLPNTEPT